MGFARVAEPRGFDDEVRKKGRAWLAEHPNASRPRPLWSPYLPHLAEGFSHLCGYTAMHVEEGSLDHFLSYANYPALTYEWDNYRFASPRVNSVKRSADDRVL